MTVDRVFAIHTGSRGFDSHRQHMSERFFRSNRLGYLHPVCSELDIMVSEWRLVIAVSLNVVGGVRLIKTGKTVHVHANTLQARRGRTHGAGCSRPWFRTAEPLGERRYENWITLFVETSYSRYTKLHASCCEMLYILARLFKTNDVVS